MPEFLANGGTELPFILILILIALGAAIAAAGWPLEQVLLVIFGGLAIAAKIRPRTIDPGLAPCRRCRWRSRDLASWRWRRPMRGCCAISWEPSPGEPEALE